MMISLIQKGLSEKCRQNNYDVIVDAWQKERDPFVII
jgi:hypothetical protein